MKKLFILTSLIIFTASILIPQDKSIEDELIEGKDTTAADTTCIKYDFSIGDTLEYRVHSHDSIVVDWDTAIVKDRYERVRVVCEDIKEETGNYWLSIEYISYIAYESKGDIKDVKKEQSNWTGRKVFIEIDSLGKRHSYKVEDTTSSALNTGGAFQPTVIQPISNECTKKGDSWLSEKDTVYYPENGYPVPQLFQLDLVSNEGYVDTLGYNTIRIDLIRTGTGTVLINDENNKLHVSSVINGHAKNYIDLEEKIPVFVYAIQEQDFDITMPGDNNTKSGKHFNNATFELERFVDGNEEDNK